ncbi:hypothetical protein SAMN05428978_102516 [Nitrosomonas sp. Nm34]|nr:hypothetical protein SAMN05428978_102516 [Nitrosomonas sp. Nm34]
MIFLLNGFEIIRIFMFLLLIRLMVFENFKLRLKNLERP